MTDRNLRVERIKELCRLQGIDRSTFLDKTGYSDSQLSAWLSPASATCICKPNTEQICHITSTFDWSTSYVFHGVLPKTNSERLAPVDEDPLMAKLEEIMSHAAKIAMQLFRTDRSGQPQ